MSGLTEVFVAPMIMVLVTIGWWLLAFLPALRELFQRSDVKPLSVVRDYDSDVHYFANRFRARVVSYLNRVAAVSKEYKGSASNAPMDGIRYLPVRSDGSIALPAAHEPKHSVINVIQTAGAATLPRETVLTSELFVKNSMHSGEANILRAILSEQDISLGKQSTVLRWLHASGMIHASTDCTLYGRASSDRMIVLENGCSFEHLHAPRIEFGKPVRHDHANQAGMTTIPISPKDLSKTVEVTGRRWLIHEDVNIPAGRYIDADIVVTGRLHVGAGCHISGSIKGHKDIQIDHGVRIDGSVVGVKNIYIAHDCFVRGPILSERDIYVGPGCLIGMQQRRTTVNAENIYIAPGTVAFGTVRARRMGYLRTGKAA